MYRYQRDSRKKSESIFPDNGNLSLSEVSKGILDIEKRLNDAEIERDILKKALGITSKSGR